MAAFVGQNKSSTAVRSGSGELSKVASRPREEGIRLRPDHIQVAGVSQPLSFLQQQRNTPGDIGRTPDERFRRQAEVVASDPVNGIVKLVDRSVTDVACFHPFPQLDSLT